MKITGGWDGGEGIWRVCRGPCVMPGFMEWEDPFPNRGTRMSGEGVGQSTTKGPRRTAARRGSALKQLGAYALLCSAGPSVSRPDGRDPPPPYSRSANGGGPRYDIIEIHRHP